MAADATPELGRILLEAGRLTPPQLEQAQRLQQATDEPLANLILQLGLVAERELAAELARALGLPLLEAARLGHPPPCIDRLTGDYLRRCGAIPIAEDAQGITVAFADPTHSPCVEALQLALGRPLQPCIAARSDILAALQAATRGEPDSTPADSAASTSEAEDIAHLRDLASEAPVIRTVNQLLARALERRASDIHLEPFDGRLQVRYRIDGVLRPVDAPEARMAAAVTSRIKVLAQLNIAERRLPQDGRIQLPIEGRPVDMRISTLPTLHGESVVVRLLDQGEGPRDLADLGFAGPTLARFEALLQRPQGILLVTGPTGSGKTTTLYAALQRLNTPGSKILTVEDPVEYQIAGVNQVQVRPGIDLTFATALRAILRQDPDILMIGEMRDTETARIAVQAALTGHKVLSTLHTNDAASSVTRLLDMQVADYLLIATLDGILAQRLVRRLCPHCRQPWHPDPEWAAGIGLAALAGAPRPLLYRPGGCERCEHTGFRGRIGIIELLQMTAQVRHAVLSRQDAAAIRRSALDEGMISLREDGLRKALDGLTTVAEVERVTQVVGDALV